MSKRSGPITLTDARRERIAAALAQLPEIKRIRLDRERTWQLAIDQYEAKTVPKNVPFFGASSLHAPITPIDADAIKARIINAVFADPRIVRVEPVDEAPITGPNGPLLDPITSQEITWRDVCELLETYILFEISDAGDVNFRAAVEDLLDEVILLGTGMMKTIWRTELQSDVNPDGSISTNTVYDNVHFDVPSLEDIYIPPGYSDLSRIPYITQSYLLRGSEMKACCQSKGWDSREVNRFLSEKSNDTAQMSALDKTQDERESVSVPDRYLTGEYLLAETWLRLDLDGNGKEVRIVVDHSFQHPDFIFRVVPWPYAHGQLPYALARYIRRRKRFYGIGIPERLAPLEEAMSTNLNQLIDNATLANTRGWKVNSNSPAMQALDRIWPGKKIPVNEMSDLEPFAMGEIYPSGFETFNILNALQEKLSKLTDYNLGRESQALGRQSTATATMALLQENGQYHDNTSREFRLAVNVSLQQYADLLVQYKPFTRIRQVLGQRGELLVAALSLPFGDLRKRISVKITFSSTAATRELARQEEMAKFQIMQQAYGGLLQLFQARCQFAVQGLSQGVQLVDAVAKDGELRVRRLLETYGDHTTATFPSWERIVSGPETASGLPPGGAASMAAAQGQPGMAPGQGVSEPQGGGAVGSTPQISPLRNTGPLSAAGGGNPGVGGAPSPA